MSSTVVTLVVMAAAKRHRAFARIEELLQRPLTGCEAKVLDMAMDPEALSAMVKISDLVVLEELHCDILEPVV